MHKPFQSLTEAEAEQLRKESQRLVAQLRSRAALRRKRGKNGKFDSKGTIRANLRYGGVPFEIKYKKKKLKPSLVLICDVSTSMRPVAEFMLRIIYELQDQVAKARSFAFNADYGRDKRYSFRQPSFRRSRRSSLRNSAGLLRH